MIMKNLMKVICTSMILVLAININAQNLFSQQSTDDRNRNTIGVYATTTWVVLNEIGVHYERYLGDEYYATVGVGIGTSLFGGDLDFRRYKFGLKKLLQERVLDEKERYVSTFIALESSYAEMGDFSVSGMARFGYRIETSKNIVMELAGGGGLFLGIKESFGFFPILDANFKVGYSF